MSNIMKPEHCFLTPRTGIMLTFFIVLNLGLHSGPRLPAEGVVLV